MASRKNLNHDEETRRKIQTSQLINRLTDHIFKDVKIEPTQLKAIEILLRKSLPDLSAIDMTSNGKHVGATVGILTLDDAKKAVDKFYNKDQK